MPPTVECDHVGDARAPGREHRDRRDEGVVALAMHDIPRAIGDGAGDSWCEVVVTPRGPGAHPPEADAVEPLAGWSPTGAIRRQDRDVGAGVRQPPRYLGHMRLDPAHVGKVARRDHENTEGMGRCR